MMNQPPPTIVQEATHAAWILVAIETTYRLFRCGNRLNLLSWDSQFQPAKMFFVAYLLCILTILLDLKSHKFAKSKYLLSFLNILVALDGVVAFLMGLGIYFQSNFLMFLSILLSSKIFLLHFLSRMVTGETSTDKFSLTIQTTKTYLHHVGNFLFLSNRLPNVVLIVAVWRFISMSGHALPFIADLCKWPPALFEHMNWIINRSRTALIMLAVLLCLLFADIRREFAVSAVGHLSYLLVRIGPVFRVGAKYFDNPIEKKRWSNELTDLQRLYILFVQFTYPLFAFEIGTMMAACLYFLLLRVMNTPQFIDDIHQEGCVLV
mmetsp:Transcript_1426/g.2307  ORF Transcript_1426/g.2307 Transcript_1426/m.2307 type:complete len:321 (+) Transcript_1426:45-1007(+)